MMMNTFKNKTAGEWLYVYVDYTYDSECPGREYSTCPWTKWIYIYPGAEETYI